MDSEMKTEMIIRDKNGTVINIGPWDYIEETLGDGSVIQHNPLPEGATSTEGEIVTLPDGGLAAADSL